MSEFNQFMGTGRRKTAVARVLLRPGEGRIRINGRSFDDYFPGERLRVGVREPLLLAQSADKFNVSVNVFGGGIRGQAEAARLGLARALLLYNPDLRTVFRQGGFLTRDSRIKERKKYGQKGARKRFQYSKR